MVWVPNGRDSTLMFPADSYINYYSTPIHIVYNSTLHNRGRRRWILFAVLVKTKKHSCNKMGKNISTWQLERTK